MVSNHEGEQVISPFLIILRVANRKALTSDTIISGSIGSMHFDTHEGAMEDNETFPDENLAGSVDTNKEASSGVGVAAIDEVPS